MNEIIEVKVDNPQRRSEAGDIYEAREIVSQISSGAKQDKSEVTIIVQAYNQLDKTKRCVESILEYTKEIDFNLIMIDNGSEPDVLDYFKTIDYPKKTIIHIEKNIGSAYPCEVISLDMLGEYIAFAVSDLIFTKNWLSNLLAVLKSDKKIGMVAPTCSNVTEYQRVELEYSNIDEMQEKAALYNVSDKAKWQERLKIVTLGYVLRKECIYAVGWPLGDMGFWHDFMDDDLCFKIRRIGYKIVLAKDTWICHDHPINKRDPEKDRISFSSGRKNFIQKYRDIDPCVDANNSIPNVVINRIKNIGGGQANILGIDVKCGIPLLDIKNTIRKYDIFDATLSAYTRKDKYVVDLKTICEGSVVCDREEFLTRNLMYAYYDYIVIDDEINGYYEPINVLMDAYMLLKEGGQLFFTLKNTNNIYALMQMLGYNIEGNTEYHYNYSMNSLYRDIKGMNINISYVGTQSFTNIRPDLLEKATNLMSDYYVGASKEEMLARLTADKVWFCIEK